MIWSIKQQNWNAVFGFAMNLHAGVTRAHAMLAAGTEASLRRSMPIKSSSRAHSSQVKTVGTP
jgi:hypothetical protein